MTSALTLHAAPGAGFDAPFEMLVACHQRVERMLRLMESLARHLVEKGCDDDARQAALDVMRYFDLAGPAHHEDEERHVLPALEARGEPALRALAERLYGDHLAMARQWVAVRAALSKVAEGGWSADGADDAAGCWSRFAALYRGHIEAEEGEAYPAVRSLIDPGAERAMGHEMAMRRGARRQPD